MNIANKRKVKTKLRNVQRLAQTLSDGMSLIYNYFQTNKTYIVLHARYFLHSIYFKNLALRQAGLFVKIRRGSAHQTM